MVMMVMMVRMTMKAEEDDDDDKNPRLGPHSGLVSPCGICRVSLCADLSSTAACRCIVGVAAQQLL